MARRDAQRKRSGLLARRAVSNVDRRAPVDANALAAASWVREWVRYAHELPETVANLGALIQAPVGDCDDMVTALASLLWRLGYDWPAQRFAIGYRGAYPRHVWLEVRGQEHPGWIPLDPSTWRLEPGESPERLGLFNRVERYNLAELR